MFNIFCDGSPTELGVSNIVDGTVSHGCVEMNPRPETSIGSYVDLEKWEIFANTLASSLQTFLCDEWKIGAPSILNESHLCVVFKTAVSLWV